MKDKIIGFFKIFGQPRAIKFYKNAAITLAFPLVMGLIMEILILINMEDAHIVNSLMDVKDIIRDTACSCFIAYALSFNLSCGRMDLSIGAQRLAGVIVGGTIAVAIGLQGLWLLLFSILFGFLFGFLTGVLFVATRVPAMVLGVGVGLVYECVAFVASDGAGLSVMDISGMDVIRNEWFALLLIALVGGVNFLLLGYTRYGYHLRAIQGSQRIAKGAGVNVFKNAILSYSFAGACVGVAGMLKTATNLSLKVQTGFTSNGPIFVNFTPMFLGMYLARWSNQTIGILVASFTLVLFQKGMSILQLTDAVQNVLSMVFFLALLVYLANENVFKVRRAEKARIALAREKIAKAAC